MSKSREEKLNQISRTYQAFYHSLVIALIFAVFVLLMMVAVFLYQVTHRPLPSFSVVAPNRQHMTLTAFDQPNLLPDTLLRWASKAAVAAYTFDFVNYEKQMDLARPYFTDEGWADYQNSVADLIATIKQNQLFINGVVSAPPVISNQGELPGHGYVWRAQIPFLVTYQSAETSSRRNFTVVISIVRVPTEVNPMGIGIDQFVMVKG